MPPVSVAFERAAPAAASALGNWLRFCPPRVTSPQVMRNRNWSTSPQEIGRPAPWKLAPVPWKLVDHILGLLHLLRQKGYSGVNFSPVYNCAPKKEMSAPIFVLDGEELGQSSASFANAVSSFSYLEGH